MAPAQSALLTLPLVHNAETLGSLRVWPGAHFFMVSPSLRNLFLTIAADYLYADVSQIYSILKHITLLFLILPGPCFCACGFCSIFACPLPLEHKLEEDGSYVY